MLLGQTTFFISDASDAKSLQQFAATLQTAEVAKVAALPGREVDAQTHSSHIGLKDFDNKQHELGRQDEDGRCHQKVAATPAALPARGARAARGSQSTLSAFINNSRIDH